MAYAKKCRDCDVQVIWDDSIVPAPGSNNKFKEVKTNLAHANRCQGKQQERPHPETQTYQTTAPYEQSKELISPPKQEQQQAPIDDFKLAQLITKVDNLNIGIAKIMSMIQTLNDLSMNAEDISRLRTENAELKQIEAKREENFVPANQVQSFTINTEHAPITEDHVKEMIKKGETEEEMEI